MINILPTEIKDQIKYSRYNVVLSRYIFLLVMVIGLLGLTLFGSHWYANRQINEYQATLADKQVQTAAYQDTETNVKALEGQLEVIEKLFNQQTKFSVLLEDLADVLPPGSYINTISLTGQDEQPVQVLMTTSSFQQAGVIRNALVKSPRIESVDIQNVGAGEDGKYSVTMVVGFTKGGAR